MRWSGLFFLLAGALTLAGCATPTTPSGAPASGGSRAAAPELTTHTRIAIGETAIEFVAPNSYCLLDDADERQFESLMQKFLPTYVIHAGFMDCAELQQRLALKSRERFVDFGYVATPKSSLAIIYNKTTDTFLDEVQKSVEKRDATRPGDASTTNQVNARAKQLGINVTLEEHQSLGVLARDKDALYTGGIQEVDFQYGKVRRVQVAVHTFVRGKLVLYFVYADYVDDLTAPKLLNAARAGVASLQQLNENP